VFVSINESWRYRADIGAGADEQKDDEKQRLEIEECRLFVLGLLCQKKKSEIGGLLAIIPTTEGQIDYSATNRARSWSYMYG
jgi:hypothetical protein